MLSGGKAVGDVGECMRTLEGAGDTFRVWLFRRTNSPRTKKLLERKTRKGRCAMYHRP